ncbi:MAG TPA: peptidylprolyl isomerase [Methylotenera sp.]|nr:peptidylprolyl isomerase [Methylotenera sp.]HPV44937.1 peptidylprolyl isomerase [Methylotenera sp.]
MQNIKLYLFGVLLACTASIHAAPSVEFQTSQGNFTVELYPEKAPKTVANFLQYVKDGFYENTIFHRVINRFMIQGGGFERDLTEKNTRAPIANESNNGLLNETGTIAMARTADPDSATAQFFVNLADNQFLNYTSPDPDQIGYCVFGKVTSGFDVVQKIGLSPTTSMGRNADVPIRPIIIKSVKLLAEVAK